MADLNVSVKVMNQIIHFSNVVEEKKTFWDLTIKDTIDVFDIAEKIYADSKGMTCSEKVFIMINSLKYSFDVEESEIWKALNDVVRWNPWIDELKKIYRDEFIRQDRICLETKYERMNKRMRRKK